MQDQTGKQDILQMKKKMIQEKIILRQVVELLVSEKLIKPEEQLRFLSILKEED